MPAQAALQRRRDPQGSVDHVQLHVPQAADDRVSVGEEAARAALSRIARTAPLRRRQGALHRLRALLERLPRQRDHGDRRRERARRPALAGRAARRALRNRRTALHLLRDVRRGVSDRRDRADAALRDGRLSAAARSSTRRTACSCRPRRASASRRTSARAAFRATSAASPRSKSTTDVARGLRRHVARRDPQDAAQRACARRRRGRMIVIAFWVLAVVLIASAVWTITAQKPVYSVVALLLNFAALAVLYLTLYAEFLAVIQIIVYSGAILMLFVFVIALLEQRRRAVSRRARTGCRRSASRRRSSCWPRSVRSSTRSRDGGAGAVVRRRPNGPVGAGGRLRQRRGFRQGALHRPSAAVRSHGADPHGRRHRRHHAGRRADARRPDRASRRRKRRPRDARGDSARRARDYGGAGRSTTSRWRR